MEVARRCCIYFALESCQGLCNSRVCAFTYPIALDFILSGASLADGGPCTLHTSVALRTGVVTPSLGCALVEPFRFAAVDSILTAEKSVVWLQHFEVVACLPLACIA